MPHDLYLYVKKITNLATMQCKGRMVQLDKFFQKRKAKTTPMASPQEHISITYV